MATERSDEDLLNGARAGDAAALESLLARYQSKVYGFGMRMCADQEDARDVLQDTLLAMARTFREFRGTASVSTWLYTIARSFCVKKRRRGRSVPAEPFSSSGDRQADAFQVADPSPGPAEEVEKRQVEAGLARAIGALAPMYREVLVLRDIDGLSAAQVADVLGIGVDAVKSRLHRARLAVRTALAPLLVVSEDPSNGRTMQRCPDVLRLFSRHLEGEISADLCTEMERHVASCPRCKSACDSLQRTLQICRAAPSLQVPHSVQESIRAQLRKLLTEQR